MFPWLDGFLSLVVDRSPEELLGAIILGLVLSAALAPVAVWIGRSKRDQIARMTGLMLVLAVVSMLGSGTYLLAQIKAERNQSIPAPGEFPIPTVVPPHDYVWLVTVLDENADGRIDPRELRSAAEALGTENRLEHYRPDSPWGGWYQGGFPDRARHHRADRSTRDERGPRREESSPRPDDTLPVFSARELQR